MRIKALAILAVMPLFMICLLNTANAESGETFGGKPAYPREDNPRSESIFVHTVEAGDVVEEGIRVINNSHEPRTIMLDPVDFLISSGGAFACKQVADPQTEVGTWIKLSKDEVTLEPNSETIVPFTITIPDDVEIGEHNGCVVMQEKIADSKSVESGINFSFRSAIRVALTVPGEIDRKLRILGYEIIYNEHGKLIIQPHVDNPGNVSVDAVLIIRIYSIFGELIKEFRHNLPVLRGEEAYINFEWDWPLLGGFYYIEYDVEYPIGDYISIGEGTEENIARLSNGRKLVFIRPTTTGLIIELVILFIICFFLFLFLLAFKRRRWIKKKWQSYLVQEGETVQIIAKKSNVSWKLLARANKLKAPYQLLSGQQILVPPPTQTKKKSQPKSPQQPPQAPPPTQAPPSQAQPRPQKPPARNQIVDLRQGPVKKNDPQNNNHF